MLKITIKAGELFDGARNVFVVNSKDETIVLEHSLVSISKWESKWHKPFLSDKPKTSEEALDYIKCMTITQNVDPVLYKFLSRENYDQINKYIEDPMTASWVNDVNAKKASREVITSELIYYWMIALNIPVEFQKWHLNRLLMLIKICNAKNQPPKKMSKGELMRRNRSLNAARRKASGSRG